jgi:hypothetical protein
MRKVTAILALAVVTVASIAAWQIGACFLANRELRDNMQDMASQAGVLVGLTQPRSDEDFRNDILRHAQEHGISLTPDQVTVRRTGPKLEEEIYLAADYTRSVHLLGLTFTFHFTPEARRQFHAADWRR